MREFCEKVADVLEVAEVTAATNFREVPNWSSLFGFALIIMIEQNYQRAISADDLQRATSVADLAKLAGVTVS